MKHRLTTIAVALLACASAIAQSSYWSQQVGLSTNFTQIDETAKTITITTPADLALLADKFSDGRGVEGGYAGWTITLANDIDLSAHVWDMPIGSEHGGEGGGNWYQFMGTFDGDGHTISGFLTDSEPLFGYVGTTATIKNVKIADAKVTRNQNGGALVGINAGSVINCAVALNVTVTANKDNAYNLGLIVGQNRGTVTGCVALGTVSDGGYQSCNALGGIVGYNSGGTLHHNLFLGHINAGSSAYDVGAITGLTQGGTFTTNLYSDLSIEKGYNTEYSVEPAVDNWGAQPAYTASTTSDIIDHGGSMTTEYKCSEIQVFPNGMVYAADLYHPDPSSHIVFSGGKGTQDDPYLIGSTADWNDIIRAHGLNPVYCQGCFFKQTADFAVSTSLGTSSAPFDGTYHGDGHTLTLQFGSQASPVATENCAPFSCVSSLTVDNLVVSGDIWSSAKYAGSIVGNVLSGTCAISNCLATATIHSTVSGDGTNGGMVGFVTNGATLTLTGCRFAGTFDGASTTCWGGFVGWRQDNAKVNLTDCLFAPVSLTVKDNDNATLVRNGTSSTSGVYYTAALGTTQQANETRSLTCGTEGCDIALVGSESDRSYSVSKLTFVTDNSTDVAILADRDIYSVLGQELRFGISWPEGYDFTRVYAASGLVGGTAAPFTYTALYRESDQILLDLVAVTEPQGSGTQDDPYLIASVTDWNQIVARSNRGETYQDQYFALAADISVSMSIGNYENAAFGGLFDGKYNGEPHTLTVNLKDSESFTAPFRFADGITLRNLTVKGTVSGGIHSAGLVGSLIDREPRLDNVIENCHVSTAVTCTGYGDSKAHGGGIVGHAHSATATITGCLFDGSITHNQSSNSGTYAGAIVGWSDNATRITVRNCIENGSYNKFANKGFGYQGTSATAASYTNSYSFQSVSGARRACPITITSAPFEGQGFEFDGTKTEYDVAGFTAFYNGFQLSDGSYYGGKNDNIPLVFSIPSGLTIQEITSNNGTLAKADDRFHYTLSLTNNNDAGINIQYNIAAWAEEGEGTEEKPYLIYNTGQMDRLANDVKGGERYTGKYFKLMADLDYDVNRINNFIPIGQDDTHQFKGIFDGGGHTISGINMTYTGNTDNDNNVGLFGYTNITGGDDGIEPAVIKNLTIANSSFTGFKHVGAIVGYNWGAEIENCHVASDVTVAAVVANAEYHGGITGYINNGGSVVACTSAASITAPASNNRSTSGTYFGGIAGANYIKVSNCLYIGATVQGKEYVGAIAGYTGNAHAVGNLYRGMMTGFGGDLSQPAVATGVGMGGYNSGNVLKDYEGAASQAFRRASKPDGIGAVVKTYGEGDYEGITVYENGLYYDGAYYSSEKLALQDNADNSSLISSSEADADVVISGRTLYKDGRWNTICLPFAVKRSASIFADATVKTLQNSTYDEATGTLTLNFTNNNPATLEAGKPYIVKWNSTEAAELKDPVFLGVTLTDEVKPVETTAAVFQGHYSPLSIAAGDKATFCLNATDQLALPEADATIGAFRCSLRLKGLDGTLDLMQLVDMVLGKAEQTGNADVNGDTRVSIADITTLIDERVNGSVKVINGNAGLTLSTNGDTWR